MNRRPILERVLDAVKTTCPEPHRILVTANGCTDGTNEMLLERQAAGQLKVFISPENLGTAAGRNLHWRECIGFDSVRIDDKVLPLYPHWLTILQRQSQEHGNALIAVPYDPTVLHLWQIAPCVDYVRWDIDQGQGGPLIFIPKAATEALGGIDELHPDIKYGWDDVLQVERARLLGHEFGFSLRAAFEFLTRADPSRRNSAMRWHGLYLERLREYREAERDVFIELGEGTA